jgi:hypothetical protein
MKKILTVASIAVLAIQVLAFIMTFNQHESAAGYGTINFLTGVCMLLLGVVLCIPQASRNAGKGMLIASAIVIIIGTAVCSQASFNFH